MRKMLAKARNYYGPVAASPDLVRRIEAFFADPTTTTWNGIYSILITPSTTIWRAVLALDPQGAPKVGPSRFVSGKKGSDLAFCPHPFTVRRAIDEALRKQGLSGLGLAMTGSQRRRLRERITPGAFGGPGAFSSVEECCRRVLAQKRLGWQYADVARRIHLVRTWNACNSHPDKQLCQVAAACLSCLDQAYSRGGLSGASTPSPSGGNPGLGAGLETCAGNELEARKDKFGETMSRLCGVTLNNDEEWSLFAVMYALADAEGRKNLARSNNLVGFLSFAAREVLRGLRGLDRKVKAGDLETAVRGSTFDERGQVAEVVRGCGLRTKFSAPWQGIIDQTMFYLSDAYGSKGEAPEGVFWAAIRDSSESAVQQMRIAILVIAFMADASPSGWEPGAQGFLRGQKVQGLSGASTPSPSGGKRLEDLLRLVRAGNAAAAGTLTDVCRWYGMDYSQTFEYVHGWTGIPEARWVELLQAADEGFAGSQELESGVMKMGTKRPGSAWEPIVGGAVSLRVKEGTAVVYTPGVVFQATEGRHYPPPGTVGRVRRMNLVGRYSTWLPGPGGGLVYVYFETGHHIGVPPQYLRKARGGRGFSSITDSSSDRPPSTATIVGVTSLLAGFMIVVGAGITGAFQSRGEAEPE